MSEAEITKPNPADFKVDLRPKEFVARFRIVAEVTETIEADDIDAALAKAKAMTETFEFAVDPQDVEEVDYLSVRKSQPMYFVTRDGKKMKVSHLEAGDEPRDPDERGY